jgi:T4 RnlA family RNA ligase
MLDKLNQYIEAGWVISQRHPTLPLTIYNYSQETQYSGKWDEVTLMCRGLVLDDNGSVIARPFKKFFNWEEIVHAVPAEQFTQDFEVFDKMDGSLGIVFTYMGELVYATRGSFTSNQAIRASEIAEKYRMTLVNDKDVYEASGYRYSGESLTLLFEIIYPENRIVVDYGGQSDLVLLGAIHTQSGEELPYENLVKVSEVLNCPVVKRYNGLRNFDEIKTLNWENSEGMVIRFANGYRMKIKFADYCAFHRIMTSCSSYDIWENLMKFGKIPEELLTKVPDEFYNWIKRVENYLRSEFNRIKETAECEYEATMKSLSGAPPDEFKKIFAIAVKDRENASLLFALKNGKDISQAVWKRVKPAYEKPFMYAG